MAANKILTSVREMLHHLGPQTPINDTAQDGSKDSLIAFRTSDKLLFGSFTNFFIGHFLWLFSKL